MRTIALLLLISSITSHVWSAEPAPTASDVRIAKIDMSELDDDLRDVVLAKAENAALKKEVEAATTLDDARSKAMQEASKAGKDMGEVLQTTPGSDGKAHQRLERLKKAELLKFIVKKFGKRYVAVLDTNYSDSIIYLDGEVVDITQSVRQALQLNEF